MRSAEKLYGTRAVFLAVFATVTVLLLAGSLWVVGFVRNRAVALEPEDPYRLPAFVNYSTNTADYVSAESNAAIAAYIQQYPEPQNAQVLVGLNTTAIWAYMTAQQSAALQVDCTYCHNIANFGADAAEPGQPDEWVARKATARIHLQMVADLNQNWLTQLADIADKQPSGVNITCATCHYGVALPVPYPEEQAGVPDDFRLPLEDYAQPFDINALRQLNVTGRTDLSLDAVQYNQHTMYYQNQSLGVGCTHCHNSRYFPEYSQPAKYYAITMLQMNAHILETYGDTFNGKEPSCALCHNNQIIPPGAVIDASQLPDVLNSEYTGGQ
jgi:photosynthetic reaction center cytochrome c subunit